MMKLQLYALFFSFVGWAASQTPPGFPIDLNSTFTTTGTHNVRIDTGTYGPPVEEFHYFYDQWPIGLAVSKTGRVFTCYTRGTYAYTLGEVVNQTAEVPYPSLEMNTPPGGLSTEMNGVVFGSTDQTHFVSVQALYVTPDDTLWVLDTGRPTINQTGRIGIPYAAPGGPKLVAINLANNSIAKTYTLPSNVHYPDSYMNDLRFDMSPNATASGGGIAYIVDSSNDGRPGFIMVDLGTGESWRQLDQHPSVLRVSEDVPSYNGIPSYFRQHGHPLDFQQEGLDGIEMDQYGEVSSEIATSGVDEALKAVSAFANQLRRPCTSLRSQQITYTQSRPSTSGQIQVQIRSPTSLPTTMSKPSDNAAAMPMVSLVTLWETSICSCQSTTPFISTSTFSIPIVDLKKSR